MMISKAASPMRLEELSKLLCDELADLLHGENMLLKALPKLTAGASAPELKMLFEVHFEQTKLQVKRLERMFATLDLPAREKKCEGMMGLLVECQHLLTRAKPSPVTDQALICAARKIEAFEAIAYQSVAAWAGLCNYPAIQEMAFEAAAEEEAMSAELRAKVTEPAPAQVKPGNAKSRRVAEVLT
jgi:ferritin-like metal-binding protein YciE